MGADERHYNINQLNKLFAIASIILFLGLISLFLTDYTRNWKNYQEAYLAIDIEKARVKLDSEETKLSKDPEFQKLSEELKQSKLDYEKTCGSPATQAVRKDVAKFSAEDEILQQKYRVVKAQLDAAKFHYEEALEKKHEEKVAEIRYKSLEQKVKQLRQSIEKNSVVLAEKQKILDDCGANLKELERKERAFSQKVTILKRKLSKSDPAAMSLTNQIANLIRNAPVIDLANPTYKINQIVLKDIRQDLNFATVPTVDRCTTCHLGIDNPDFKEAAQPLRAHPNLELYLGKNSPHALEEFGCTTCHDGRGRGTDFNSAAHTPSSEKQAEEWKKKYGWQELHHWEKPMLAKPYIEAGCFKCHSGQSTIKGAEKLNLGLHLIERSGCYACHDIEKYKDWPKPGPDLTKIASKLSPDWTYRWIANPKEFRHSTWMPSYFGQSNNNDPASLTRSQQEIHAIVTYLFSESKDFKIVEMPYWGDAKKGEEIVSSIGCLGCHNLEDPKTSALNGNVLNTQHGPALVGLGSKTSKSWIYQWLKDPQRYHPGTRMPNLRLTDNEAADAAAFLAQDKNEEFTQGAVPPIDEKILNEIMAGFLKKNMTEAQSHSRISQMSQEEKLKFAGQKLISQYGCYSCHDINGFKGFKPIGPDLNEEGDKAVSKFDFGFLHLEHNKQAWMTQKLKDPRSFDKGKLRAPDEKLLMPNFYFTNEEAEAIVTALTGFVRNKPGKAKPETPEQLAINKGQRIVRELNCQGCHVIEGEGGAIQPSTTDWLVRYKEKEAADAKGMTLSFSPPNLIGEGKRVQSQWLYDFLHDPSVKIRPALKVRMPTYTFRSGEINDLLQYFNALDEEEFPFTDHVNLAMNAEELEAAHKLLSPEYFDCAKCHVINGKMPSGSDDTWAPDFALAAKRLKPDWVIDWIKNPPALMPGTKMPAFFDPANYHEAGPPDILNGDEDEQIRVLRNYIMSISTLPATPVSKSKEPRETPPAPEAPKATSAQPPG